MVDRMVDRMEDRMVGVTEAKELLIDVDPRVKLVVRRKTLTLILQYSDSRGPGSDQWITARCHHRIAR